MSKHFLSFTESEEVLWVWVAVNTEQTEAAEVCTLQGWSYRMTVNFQSRTKAVCSFTSVVLPGAQVLGCGGPGGPLAGSTSSFRPSQGQPPISPPVSSDQCSLQVHRARWAEPQLGGSSLLWPRGSGEHTAPVLTDLSSGSW